jgi:recombinational DNA repair protein RecR
MAKTTSELVTACKIGLQLDTTATFLDGLIEQKILAVKGFLSNAGVSDTQLDSDTGIGAIVLGVSDLWVLDGKAEFSNLFHMLVSQLKYVSMTESVV